MEYATEDNTFLITYCLYILFSSAHSTQKSDQVHAIPFILPNFYLSLNGNLDWTMYTIQYKL